MTMHIYFKRDKDGYTAGWSGYVERTLARRFCRENIAIPYQQHIENVRWAEEAVKEAKKEVPEVVDEKEDKELSTPKKKATRKSKR